MAEAADGTSAEVSDNIYERVPERLEVPAQRLFVVVFAINFFRQLERIFVAPAGAEFERGGGGGLRGDDGGGILGSDVFHFVVFLWFLLSCCFAVCCLLFAVCCLLFLLSRIRSAQINELQGSN